MNFSACHVAPYALSFDPPQKTGHGHFRVRSGLLVALSDTQGRTGWGDVAPWPGFSDQSLPKLRQGLVRASIGLLLRPTLPVKSTEQLRHYLEQISLPNEGRYGVELAMLDLLGQRLGISITQLLNPEARVQTLPICRGVSSIEEAQSCISLGVRHLKLKVGVLPLWDDVARIRALRNAVGPETAIRVDANGAWDIATARQACDQLSPYGLEWIEQPISPVHPSDWSALRGRSCTIAIDESACDPNMRTRIMTEGLADVLVLKPSFLGGLLKARSLALEARKRGMRFAISDGWESGIGRLGSVHLAAALSPNQEVPGLSCPFAEDLVGPLPMDQGRLAVPQKPGLGASPQGPVELRRVS